MTEIKNRKAWHDYEMIENFTAGIVVTGAEVKAVRAGKASIDAAFCVVLKNSCEIRGMHIQAGEEYTRSRRLLLNKSEIKDLAAEMKAGRTIIPLKAFFTKTGLLKIEIAVARGKKNHDKRNSIKLKDLQRETGKMFK